MSGPNQPWQSRVQQVAPFYVERGSRNPEYQQAQREGKKVTPDWNWQIQGYWYRIGLVPPVDNNDTTNTGTGTMPTANALWFALQNISIGGNKTVYVHFRASFTDYYDTAGAFEWRIARLSMRTVLDRLTEGPVRDVRTGSGAWFDGFMQDITGMPIGTVLTVRIKEAP